MQDSRLPHRDANAPAFPPVSLPEDDLEGLYGRLREIAGAWMSREPAGNSLQPTALVHEAWMRMEQQERSAWRDQTHYCSIASTAMRRVLIDHARRRHAGKRGQAWSRVSLSLEDPAVAVAEVDSGDLVEALDRLGATHERLAKIAELRFLGGLSVAETAQVLGVSERTVKLDWRLARAWLARELEVDP